MALLFSNMTWRLSSLVNRAVAWLINVDWVPNRGACIDACYSDNVTRSFRLCEITLFTFIEGCFRSDAAADFLRRLPIVLRTDGSFPYSLGAEGACVLCSRGVQKMLIAYPPLHCPSQLRRAAESLALVHGLEWCHSHLKACHVQSTFAFPRPRHIFNQNPFGIFGPPLEL